LVGFTSSSEAKASSKSAAIYAASSGAVIGSAALTGSACLGVSVEALPFLFFPFLAFFLGASSFGGAAYS